MHGTSMGATKREDAMKTVEQSVIALSRTRHTNLLAFQGVVLHASIGVPKLLLFEPVKATLGSYLASLKSPLSLNEFWGIAVDVFSAVSHLHSCGMTHGNITLDSMFVIPFRSGIMVKLCLPVLPHSPGSSSARSLYTAPELPPGAVSTAGDVYAAGMVLCEIVVRWLAGTVIDGPLSPSDHIKIPMTAVSHLSTHSGMLSRLLSACTKHDADRHTAEDVVEWLSSAEIVAAAKVCDFVLWFIVQTTLFHIIVCL